jgi:hypothetical protein
MPEIGSELFILQPEDVLNNLHSNNNNILTTRVHGLVRKEE